MSNKLLLESARYLDRLAKINLNEAPKYDPSRKMPGFESGAVELLASDNDDEHGVDHIFVGKRYAGQVDSSGHSWKSPIEDQLKMIRQKIPPEHLQHFDNVANKILSDSKSMRESTQITSVYEQSSEASNDDMLATIEGIMGRKADRVHSDGRHEWKVKGRHYPVVYHSEGSPQGALVDRIVRGTVTYPGEHNGKIQHLSRRPDVFNPEHLKASLP